MATKRTTVYFLLILSGIQFQSARAQDKSPDPVVQQFCQSALAGRELNPTGAKETAKTFLLNEHSWEDPAEIIIVRDFTVRPLNIQNSTAEFTVEYRVLGRLDSELRLTRLQMPYTNQPLSQEEHFSLVLTDTHFELASDGRLQPVKGVPEWRIKLYPAAPHIGIAAAMQFVRVASHRPKDASARLNAEKALAELQNLQMSSMAPGVGSIQQSPQDVLSQFIEMQMDGRGLSQADSHQLDIFLINPAQLQRERISIARAYVIKRTAFSGKSADVFVEYAALGELDSQLHFTAPTTNGNVIGQDYKLVLSDKYSFPARNTIPPREFTGPSRWRIDQAPAEQWISVTAAIRYLTEMEQTTNDAVMKNNAEKALAALAKYH